MTLFRDHGGCAFPSASGRLELEGKAKKLLEQAL
jgi:hypothetical protein